MTAPLDIGLDQQDASLGLGQDDIFDLGGTENGLRKRGGIQTLMGDDGELLADSSGEEDESMEGDNEVLDSEEEREKKTMGLEAELDELYDAYQSRMRERDVKFKVKESREKNANREEWHGIQVGNDEEEEDSDEGGWDKIEQAKKRADESSSDEDSDDDSDDEMEAKGKVLAGRKRAHAEEPPATSKRVRLINKLEDAKPAGSKAAQVWFSQGVFADMEGLDVEDEDDDETADDDEEMSIDEEGPWEDAVGNLSSSVRSGY